MQQLRKIADEHRPVAFIPDPFAELHDSEENANIEMRQVVAMFRELAIEYNMAIAIPHHSRKGSAEAAGDPDVARGAGAIHGAAKITLTLTTMSPNDAKAFFSSPLEPEDRQRYIRLDDARQKYGAPRQARWFEKRPVLLRNGETAASVEPWLPPEKKVATEDDLAVC